MRLSTLRSFPLLPASKPPHARSAYGNNPATTSNACSDIMVWWRGRDTIGLPFSVTMTTGTATGSAGQSSDSTLRLGARRKRAERSVPASARAPSKSFYGTAGGASTSSGGCFGQASLKIGATNVVSRNGTARRSPFNWITSMACGTTSALRIFACCARIVTARLIRTAAEMFATSDCKNHPASCSIASVAIPGSSNGRTADSDSAYRGSSP